MATSTFTQAIQCLVAERDRVFVERIAAEYNLPLEELRAKYLESSEAAIKVPRQYKKREPKAVKVTVEGEPPKAKAPKEPKAKADKQCCTAQTSKKEPCKFSALKGEVFCKRHLKQSLGEASEPKAKKAQKAEQPVHTHTLDSVTHAECDLCQSHGNPLDSVASEFEVVVAKPVVAAHTGPVKPAPPRSVEERLAALLAESESESEGESEVEVASEGEGEGMESEYEEE
jgi:hypothetical protein